MFLSSWHPDPILVSLGQVHIYWYGLMLALGAIAGLFVILRLGRRAGLPSPLLTDLFIFLVIGGLIGARLYHVVNEWGFYAEHPNEIWQLWNGGLAIHGAMIAGLIIVLIFSRAKKINAWLLIDVLTIGLVLGQAIGRWGNFFNQELFGRPTTLPWKLTIDEVHRPAAYVSESFFHPTFLYESFGCLIIFGILYFLFARRSGQKAPNWISVWSQPGTIALTYFILYSLLRIGMESLRIDRVPLIAGVRLPWLTSIAIMAIAIAVWVIRTVHRPRPLQDGASDQTKLTPS